MSATAKRGKKLFASPAVGCAVCHPAPLFTDCRSHAVGTTPEGRKAIAFDTPSLVECWRTAPYLHDGSAATIRDVLTSANRKNLHGKTTQLSAADLDALVAYVLSL